jgi:hypothetical protein
MVQALLGGFVDVNAADGYKKFMKSPQASLIPKVGAQFPMHLLESKGSSSNRPSDKSQSIGFDDSKIVGKSDWKDSATAIGKESLRDGNIQEQSQPIQSQAKSKAQAGEGSSSITFDDNASKTESQSLVVEAAKVVGPSEVSASENATTGISITQSIFIQQANRDLSSIEIKKKEKDSALDEEDFFKGPGEKEEKGLEKLEGIKKRKFKPQGFHWTLNPLLRVAERIFILEAHAEEETNSGGDCENCKSGKGGGGADAAAVLMGIAGIIAAITPMVVASTQAKADQNIAKINAETQKYMTDRTAQNSERLAALQQQTALSQAQTAANVATQNNQGVTQRLQMQLAELRAAKEDAMQAEERRLAYEKSYNDQRLQLVKDQAAENLRLAKATLNAQLTQAGLSQGTVSAGSLGVASSGLGSTINTAAINTGVNSGVLGTSTSPRATTSGIGGLISSNAAGVASTGLSSGVLSSIGRRALTDSKGPIEEADDMFNEKKLKEAAAKEAAAKTPVSKRAARGLSSIRQESLKKENLKFIESIPENKESDLKDFIKTQKTEELSFIQFLRK